MTNANVLISAQDAAGGTKLLHGALGWLFLLGVSIAALTLATPVIFWKAGDNAYMAMAIATGLVAMMATPVAERAPAAQAIWLIMGVAVLLRLVLLLLDPLLSDDIYRYIWDGKVQAAGINPYRYVPADPALTTLRDSAVYPNINRIDSAVTIYPPVAQMFFFVVTRIGENVTTMKLALLACEAGTVATTMLLLRRCGRPMTRIVAYAWHPLPMWEIANNGHVDALMVALMMLGIWLALSARSVGGAAAVTLGALAKPFAAVALPVLWRPWDWKVPLIVLGVIALCYAPYLSVGTGVFGYLTTGYISEEGFDTGANVWPLAAMRQIAGAFPGDFALYVVSAALLMAGAALRAAYRHAGSAQSRVADVAWLLLLVLFLVSPNYPWYFLIATPFVALVGGAPVWAFTVGAVLLQEEVTWDPFIPLLVRKSLLYGTFLVACAYVVWSWRSRWLNQEIERDHTGAR